MKKMVALALAITMLMSLAGAASAATLSIPARCDSTTNYTRNTQKAYKTTGTAAIYEMCIRDRSQAAYNNTASDHPEPAQIFSTLPLLTLYNHCLLYTSDTHRSQQTRFL